VMLPPNYIAGANGAGDALAAGVLLGIYGDWEMQECLKLGVCTAAASLSHVTCSDGVQPYADCLLLGDTYGFRTVDAD
jgi:sugar/nucleoside kinase (ribokinase family)